MITNGYCTLAEIKARLDIPTADVTQDASLENRVETASRAIDGVTGDFFYQLSATAMVFDTTYPDMLFVPSLLSVTALATDEDDDGTFETTWATGDYTLEPATATAFGRPSWLIRRRDAGTRFFPVGWRRAQVTGTWGWPVVPDVINEACLILATRYSRRPTLPFGLVGSPELAPLQLLPAVDPDVKALLTPFRRMFWAVPV